jgi:hypothetical protein
LCWIALAAGIALIVTIVAAKCIIAARLRRVARLRKMIQVYKIPASKEKLRAMPEGERALLILLGYAANQINFFSKVVIFSTNRDGDTELEQQLSAAQTQMALRVVVGVVNEAWRLIKTRFMDQPCAKEYTPLLDQAGADAFVKLKKVFGNSGLFATLRGTWIFHHPNNPELNSAFEDAASNPQWGNEWNWFFSHSNYNSFYFLSEFVVLHGILKAVGETDLLVGQEKLTKQITAVSEDMSQFIMALIAVLWKKYFGAELTAETRFDIPNAPGFFDVWIPFFVDIPPAPAAGST